MDADELPLIPGIPDDLQLAAREGILVPFIGAGISMLAGCPGWGDLADKALQFFVNEGLLDHGEHDQLRTLHPRVKLSIAQGLEVQHHKQINFRDLLAPSDAEKRTGEALYADLSCTEIQSRDDD